MTISRENRTTTSARLSSFGLEDGPLVEAVLAQRNPPETLHEGDVVRPEEPRAPETSAPAPKAGAQE